MRLGSFWGPSSCRDGNVVAGTDLISASTFSKGDPGARLSDRPPDSRSGYRTGGFIIDEWAATLVFVVNEARSAAAGMSKTRGPVIAWTQLQNYPPTLVSSNPGFVRFLLHPRFGDLLRSWQKNNEISPRLAGTGFALIRIRVEQCREQSRRRAGTGWSNGADRGYTRGNYSRHQAMPIMR